MTVPFPLLASFVFLSCLGRQSQKQETWGSSLPTKIKDSLVILVTLDGLRVEEVLGGLDTSLCNQELGGVSNPAALRSRYDAPTLKERRERLLPFFWKVMVPQGQFFGDPEQGSPCKISNKVGYSYPGYAELLQGFADPRILSNRKQWNRNQTVLEWLGKLPEFQKSIIGFGSWENLPFIVNTKRNGLPINAGFVPLGPSFKEFTGRTKLPPSIRFLDRIQRGIHLKSGKKQRLDSFSFMGALEVLKHGKPRVLWLGLGETDGWGHRRRYDLYLEQVHHADRYLRRLWEFCQRTPRYKGRCSLIVTCDHGRGRGNHWTSHGARVPGSEQAWIAVLGAHVPSRGIRRKRPTRLSQVASTLAWLLGFSLKSWEQRASRPLPLAKEL
jgi:hypothetical protein